jgi:hypothetical protein
MTEKHNFMRRDLPYILLTILQVMLPVLVPGIGATIFILVVLLFQTGPTAEFLRLFALGILLMSITGAILRFLILTIVVKLKMKRRERDL